jgi:hypothetical protein
VLRTRNPEVAVFPNAIRALPELRNFLDPQVRAVQRSRLGLDESEMPHADETAVG